MIAEVADKRGDFKEFYEQSGKYLKHGVRKNFTNRSEGECENLTDRTELPCSFYLNVGRRADQHERARS